MNKLRPGTVVLQGVVELSLKPSSHFWFWDADHRGGALCDHDFNSTPWLTLDLDWAQCRLNSLMVFSERMDLSIAPTAKVFRRCHRMHVLTLTHISRRNPSMQNVMSLKHLAAQAISMATCIKRYCFVLALLSALTGALVSLDAGAPVGIKCPAFACDASLSCVHGGD